MSSLYQAPSIKETAYEDGAERVVAKLHSMGIPIPQTAVAIPPGPHPNPLSAMHRRCTLLEEALLDRFDVTDLCQAASLIHYQAPRADWHALHLLTDDFGFDLERLTLCPSLLDALGATVTACDGAAMRLETCRRNGEAVELTVGSQVAFRIEPIKIEPFNLALRDRVRTTFKGVRTGDFPAILRRALRLPGFALTAAAPHVYEPKLDDGFFISSPANWALGMRGALAQVGIAVKQAQAQELVAVLFGASSWHQLIKHRNDLHMALKPVAVTQMTGTGPIERFYHTTEEAIFAFSEALKYSPEPLVVNHLSKRGQYQVSMLATTPAELEAQNASLERHVWEEAPSCLTCEDLESYSIADHAQDEQAVRAAAEQLLAALKSSSTAASSECLYARPDVFGVLEAKFRRSGATVGYMGQVGRHVVAIFQLKAIDGSQGLARIGIYRIEGDRALNALDEALYKATLSYHPEVDGGTLTIEPDYGHKPPMLVPLVSPDQVRPLLDIAGNHNVFTNIARLRGSLDDGPQLY